MRQVDGIFFRPVLHVSKQDLLTYLTERNLEWREDSSNESRVYKRNKVRLDLIPIMAELAGGQEALSRRLLALSMQGEDVKELLNDQVKFVLLSYQTCCFELFY
jgi:tRNA(Ile)-lysidine synthase